jgi:hypothetical protein
MDMLLSKLDIKHSQRIHELRLEGKTYKEIGLEIGVSDSYARMILKCHEALIIRPKQWTEGLPIRMKSALLYAGFKSKWEVTQVASLSPECLKSCFGIGPQGFKTIQEWCKSS